MIEHRLFLLQNIRIQQVNIPPFSKLFSFYTNKICSVCSQNFQLYFEMSLVEFQLNYYRLENKVQMDLALNSRGMPSTYF
jgi:hypothetical protein